MQIDKEQFEPGEDKHFGNVEDGQLLTPEEAANRLKVTTEQIRCLIRKGQLPAINVGSGTKRPLYRIAPMVLNDFLKSRSQPSPRLQKRKFKKLSAVPDLFPNLK